MRESVENCDSAAAAAAAKRAVDSGIDLLEAVEKGFSEPIRELGQAGKELLLSTGIFSMNSKRSSSSAPRRWKMPCALLRRSFPWARARTR
jgi:hypothetical protein